MSSITHAGRDARNSCFFAIVVLTIVGVFLYPVLSDPGMPLWRRIAVGLGAPILAWLGALVGLVLVAGGIGLLFHLRDVLDHRRRDRIVAILEGQLAERPGEVERLVARALTRGEIASPYAGLGESDVVVETARRDGPHRRSALRLLLRHGRGAAEESPVRAAVVDGAELLEAEGLSEDDRLRLERWSRDVYGATE